MTLVPSPSAFVTAELAAMVDRLHAAALTVECLPADGPKGTYSLWPRYRLTWWDPGNEDSKLSGEDITRRLIAPPRFMPTARQIDDCLPALALMEGATKDQWRVVSMRAHQLWYGIHAAADEDFAHWRGGWRRIGQCIGISHEKARGLHSDAIRQALEKDFRGAR